MFVNSWTNSDHGLMAKTSAFYGEDQTIHHINLHSHNKSKTYLNADSDITEAVQEQHFIVRSFFVKPGHS